MKILFAILIGLHGAIHFLGVAKAFRLADLPQLTQPISRGAGIAWLIAGLLLIVSAVLFLVEPHIWWIPGLVAAVLSQGVIISSWGDAKVGTVANVMVLCAIVYGLASEGPWSLRTAYRDAIETRITEAVALPDVTEADLASLPLPVQRYLRVTGSVGQPRVTHVRATWNGRIRSGPGEAWMPFTAEQHNFLDRPARFFLMDARRSGLPVDVLHGFDDHDASMQARVLSLVPVVDVQGPDLHRAETVTFFNDLCLLAPAALIDPAIRWEPIDDHSALGHFSIGVDTISATLIFNESGELINFVSEDREALSTDGTRFVRQRWSTPVGGYRRIGTRTVMTEGKARWHPPENAFTYVEMTLVDLETNGGLN